ncbi:MAG: hypothetical protein EOP49_30385, partial [Sphingobacteriales bacterium]
MNFLTRTLILLTCVANVAYMPAQAQRYQKRVYTIPSPAAAVPLDNDGELDLDCARRYHFPIQERRSVYPFKNATSVVLVSFRTPLSALIPADSIGPSDYDYTAVPGSRGIYPNCQYPKSFLVDSIPLADDMVDSLTAILYNYDYKKIPPVPPALYGSGCYAPHNAIMFYNRSNRLFAFIELCFTCQGIRESDNKVDSGVPCEGKLSLLKQFFIDNGIVIGTQYIP